MLLISEKIYIKKSQYYKYIFTRGLDTIITVFKIMLFYTKNLDLTYYHSQKAFYFYVEFIEQISNDQNTFLQLSSREACVFVYKKTIYELVNDYKKINELNWKEEKVIFNNINKYLFTYKNIITFFINHDEFNYENKIAHICDFSKKLKSYSESINNNILVKEEIECYEIFISCIIDKNITMDQLFCLGELFVIKLQQKALDNYLNFQINLKNKIYFVDSNIKDEKLIINEIFNGS
jgi:hypothetical protein